MIKKIMRSTSDRVAGQVKTRFICRSASAGLLALGMVFANARSLEAAPELPPDDDWTFTVKPYAWAAGIKGKAGVGDVTADMDVSFNDLLNAMKIAGMLDLEARKARWGVLVDGIYMKLSSDVKTPGPFFNVITPTVKMSVLDMALAYRVVEGDRGWLDLLLGGRYIDLSAKLDMTPDYAAVDQISSTVIDEVTKTVIGQVEDVANRKAGQIAGELATVRGDVGAAASEKIRDELQIRASDTADLVNQKIDEIMDKVASIPPRKLDQIKAMIQEKLAGVTDAQREALADAVEQKINAQGDAIKGKAAAIQQEISNAAEEKRNELRNNASAKAQHAVDAAEKQLADAITQGMTAAANADLEMSREWVDPYVGARGRLNLTQRTFLGARADIGGFNVGSKLTWQVFGGIGVQVTDRVEVEAGYRRLAIDYDRDNLLMDVAFSGAVVGLGVKF